MIRSPSCLRNKWVRNIPRQEGRDVNCQWRCWLFLLLHWLWRDFSLPFSFLLLRHAALNLLRCSSRTCQRFVSIAMVATVVVWVIAPIIAPFVGPQSLVAVCIEA